MKPSLCNQFANKDILRKKEMIEKIEGWRKQHKRAPFLSEEMQNKIKRSRNIFRKEDGLRRP